MMNRTFSTMMTSAVVLGSLLVGCSGGQDRPKLTVNDSQTGAPKIERMLADRNYDQALAAAEQLVTVDPQNANARAILGRAYLANGRYISARMAFTDSITLGNRDPRTIVSLSLVQSGLGDLNGARSLLSNHISDLPAADYGLAIAMAGDPREGVRALIEAARAPDATVKTRQNLAYALALAGAWAQARLIAGQDLSARDAEVRIGEWTQAFSGGSASSRVVAMLGVSPRTDDAGLPAQLALNAAPEIAPVQLASASDLIQDAASRSDPAPVAASVAPITAAEPVQVAEFAPAAPSAPVKIAEFKPKLSKVAAPVAKPAFSSAAIAAVLAKPPAAPLSMASVAEQLETVDRGQPALDTGPAPAPAARLRAPAAQPVLKAAFIPTTAVAPAPAVTQVAPVTPQETLKRAFIQPGATAPKATPAHGDWMAGLGKPATRPSNWVVQLGAFDSPVLARTQWVKISQSRATLKDYGAVHSTVQVNGRTFYRLAVRGFENRGAAWATCGVLRTSGQDCFVRLDDKTAAPQAASERGSGRVRASR
jgi:Flp pilus assembly protein TadD